MKEYENNPGTPMIAVTPDVYGSRAPVAPVLLVHPGVPLDIL